MAMSVEGQDEGQPLSPQQKSPDFAHMTEEEQIAFAMQMSLQENQDPTSTKASSDKKKDESEAMEVEDYTEVMNDPEFLQSVLENLRGVDPQSEAVRQAVGSLNKKDDKKDKKPWCKKDKDGAK